MLYLWFTDVHEEPLLWYERVSVLRACCVPKQDFSAGDDFATVK